VVIWWAEPDALSSPVVSALASLALAASSLVTLAVEHASAPVEGEGEVTDLVPPVSGPTAPAAGVVPSPVDEFKSRAQAFSRFRDPATGKAGVFGGYSNGCLVGGVPLPRSGPGFELMRLGRNRRYGHPDLVAFIRRLGAAARKKKVGTLLIGDMAQPRGGPTPTGHRSHQTGLDVDIGFTRPDWLATRRLKASEREQLSQIPVVDLTTRTLTAEWGPKIEQLIELAATDPDVDRIFVHPRIKRELCDRAAAEASALAAKVALAAAKRPRKTSAASAMKANAPAANPNPASAAAASKSAPGATAAKALATAAVAGALDRAWLHNVRPWWGHHDHLHVRLKCPADSPDCESQPPIAAGDGCGELAWWETEEARRAREPQLDPVTGAPRPPPPLPPLPDTCQALLDPVPPVASGARSATPPR
jgi:penicillin-insensitive murein endopeptidase